MAASCGNPEDIVTCPFKESHRVVRKYLVFHVAKCTRKHFPGNKIVECIYNNAHRVRVDKLKLHMFQCPDRFNMFLDSNIRKYPFANTKVETDKRSDDVVNAPTGDSVNKCETSKLPSENVCPDGLQFCAARFWRCHQSGAATKTETVERKTAVDFKSSTDLSGVEMCRDEDEESPFVVVPLMQRIRFGLYPYQPKYPKNKRKIKMV